jgi:hypothetical protein
LPVSDVKKDDEIYGMVKSKNSGGCGSGFLRTTGAEMERLMKTAKWESQL